MYYVFSLLCVCVRMSETLMVIMS